MTAQRQFTWHTALLSGIFLAALLLLTWDIDAPFVRQGSYDEIIYTLHARAFDRYGLIETRLALVYPPGDPTAPLTDTNHHASRSVLLTILLTLVYKLLGYREWAGRLIGIASILVSLLALYSFTKRLWTMVRLVFAPLHCFTWDNLWPQTPVEDPGLECRRVPGSHSSLCGTFHLARRGRLAELLRAYHSSGWH